MNFILSGIAAFFTLLGSLWEAYQREVKKREIREEVRLEQLKKEREANLAARKVRDDVATRSDSDLDRELSKYYRD
jgi:lysozyme family protein